MKKIVTKIGKMTKLTTFFIMNNYLNLKIIIKIR